MGQITYSAALVVLVAVTGQLAFGAKNLLKNPDFEDSLTGTWETTGSNMVRTNATGEVLTGNFAVKITNRKNENSGIAQLNIPFVKGHHYVFEGYVKMLNDQTDRIYQVLKANIQIVLLDGSKHSYNIAYRSFCESSQGWIRLRGDIEAPEIDFTDPRLIVRGAHQTVNFLADNFTLFEETEDDKWRMKADKNIDKFRKSKVVFKVKVPKEVPPGEVDVEVELKSHQFAFGSMLRADEVMKQPTTELMKLAYYMFDWATIQNYKWKFHKGHPLNNSDLSIAINATKILIANGKKVRGHSIFWNVDKNIPTEVLALSGPELEAAVGKHVVHVMKEARGLISQWDVQNEHIAGHYFEETTRKRNITQDLFRLAKMQNDKGILYMNEFQCVTSGAQTEQYYDLASEYLARDVPLEGLGIQGHTKEYVRPNPTAMWKRIDRLAELKLPIMMTEFDIGWSDIVQRADWFEDSVRAFFGNPNLTGLILWDFYNETMRNPDHELVSGDGTNFVIEEPGQRWICLVKKEWTTKLSFKLDPGKRSLRKRFNAFRGDYQVVVKRNNLPVQKEAFTVGDQDTEWKLDVTTNQAPITLETERDYVPECISHREQRSLGKAVADSSDSGLTCRTVQSKVSGGNENDAVSVSCGDKEVLTGCFSFHTDGKWTRNGEKIEVDETTGQAKCTAYNGAGSTGGVKAFARCCKALGLSCDYRTAGPSFPFDGAMAEASCPAGHVALGCSTYGPFPDMDGVRPNDNLSGCRAQAGAPVSTNPAKKSGVYAYSACCKANTPLQCVRVESPESKAEAKKSAKVSCPRGTIVTGCSAFAADGKSVGAKIDKKNKECSAQVGKNIPKDYAVGVRAYATCCVK